MTGAKKGEFEIPEQEAGKQKNALIDIGIFFLVAVGIYLLEKGFRSTGLNPLPEAMDGALSLIVSLFVVFEIE